MASLEESIAIKLSLITDVDKKLTKITRQFQLLDSESRKASRETFLKQKFALQDRLKDERKAFSTMVEQYKTRASLFDKEEKKRQAQIKKTAQIERDRFKAAKSFQMHYLGLMFAGMAMQRTFGGILTSSYQVYNKITEGTDKAGGAITRLNAAWNFFKFSLIDALTTSPFFSMLIEWAIKFVDYLSTMSTEVAVFLISMTAIGTLLMVGGQIMLGVNSLQALLTTINGQAVTLGTTLKGIAGMGLVISATFDFVSGLKEIKKGEWITGLMDAVKGAIKGYVGLRWLSGKSAGPWFAIAVGLEIVDSTAFMTLIKVLASLMYAVISSTIDMLSNYFEIGFVDVVKNAMISLLQSFIAMVSWGPLSYLVPQVNQMIKSLENYKTKAKDFDFGKSFKDNFSSAYKDLKENVPATLTEAADEFVKSLLPAKEAVGKVTIGGEYTPSDYTPVPNVVQQNNYYGMSSIDEAKQNAKSGMEQALIRGGINPSYTMGSYSWG